MNDRLEITQLGALKKEYLKEFFRKTNDDFERYIENMTASKKDLVDLGKENIIKEWLSTFPYGDYVFKIPEIEDTYDSGDGFPEIVILIRLKEQRMPYSFENYHSVEVDDKDFIELLWENNDWEINEYVVREIKWLPL